jgi:uncharacterized membrane protein
LSHEQADTTGRDDSRLPTGGRHDEHDSATPLDIDPAGAEQRDGDHPGSAEDGALSAARHTLEDLDAAIDAEIVEDRPKRRHAVMASWSGHLPHPDDAERYEALSPGTLDRLLELQERRMGVMEHDMRIEEQREVTIRVAVDAEADVNRSLADADKDALQRGQWLSWTISLAAMVAVIVGLMLGYPQALWAIGVPIVQAGATLVRTVTQDSRDSTKGKAKAEPADG